MPNMEKFPGSMQMEAQGSEGEQQKQDAELAQLLGIEDVESVANLVKSLQAEIEAGPQVGRTLQEQKGTHRKEFVIPLTSKEQKERLLGILSEMAIYPWEENGLLIVERMSDLEKLQKAGIIAPDAEEPETPDIDPVQKDEYTFGANIEAELFPQRQSKREAQETTRRSVLAEEESDEEGLDTELQDLLERFDQGLVDDDDQEIISSLGSLPTLSLFPRQYIWEGRTLRHARTGEVISKEELAQWRGKAKEGDAEHLEKCVRVHTGLVLHALARLKKLWPQANADDLLQEGLIGLTRSLQIYDPEGGSAFSSHAMNHIESRMRRYIQAHERGDIVLPVHTSSQRAAYYRAEKELIHEHPEKAVDRRGLSERLGGKQRGFAAGMEYGLDKFERTYFIHSVFDPLDESFDDEFTQDEVDMRGEPLVEQGAEGESNREHDKHHVVEHLSTLQPSQQVVLRLRFGIFEPPLDEKILIEALGNPFRSNLQKLPESSKRIVQTLTGGKPEDLDPLSFNTLSEAEQVVLYLCGKVPESVADTEVIRNAKSEGLTLEQVGKILNNISRERVRGIEAKGLRLLRHPIHSRQLRVLLPDNGAETLKWRAWRKSLGYDD